MSAKSISTRISERTVRLSSYISTESTSLVTGRSEVAAGTAPSIEDPDAVSKRVGESGCALPVSPSCPAPVSTAVFGSNGPSAQPSTSSSHVVASNRATSNGPWRTYAGPVSEAVLLFWACSLISLGNCGCGGPEVRVRRLAERGVRCHCLLRCFSAGPYIATCAPSSVTSSVLSMATAVAVVT